MIIGERKTPLLPLAATDLSYWFHKLKKLFSDSVRDDGAPNPCLVVRPLGCPDGIRGLQLGEEKAPLIRVCRTPGSLKRRIHRIHGIYLRQADGFLQILAWQIWRKRLTRRGKPGTFISRERPLDGPNLPRCISIRIKQRLFQLLLSRFWLAEARACNFGVSFGPHFSELFFCRRCFTRVLLLRLQTAR